MEINPLSIVFFGAALGLLVVLVLSIRSDIKEDKLKQAEYERRNAEIEERKEQAARRFEEQWDSFKSRTERLPQFRQSRRAAVHHQGDSGFGSGYVVGTMSSPSYSPSSDCGSSSSFSSSSDSCGGF